MRRDDELLIHIKQNHDIVVENIENGVVSCKTISPDVLVDCVAQSLRNNTISSGVLPEGSFSYASGDDFQNVFIEFPERFCDIVYETTEYKHFPLPRLLFGFQVSSDNRIKRVQLAVADTGRLTPKTKMFIYPFSNVNGFGLCCGANRLPPIKSLYQLTGVMYFILSMPNNNDHYRPSNTYLELELRHLFETLKDKSPDYYYSNVLKESGKTVLDFITS